MPVAGGHFLRFAARLRPVVRGHVRVVRGPCPRAGGSRRAAAAAAATHDEALELAGRHVTADRVHQVRCLLTRDVHHPLLDHGIHVLRYRSLQEIFEVQRQM